LGCCARVRFFWSCAAPAWPVPAGPVSNFLSMEEPAHETPHAARRLGRRARRHPAYPLARAAEDDHPLRKSGDGVAFINFHAARADPDLRRPSGAPPAVHQRVQQLSAHLEVHGVDRRFQTSSRRQHRPPLPNSVLITRSRVRSASGRPIRVGGLPDWREPCVHYGAGGPVRRVFFRSGLNFWFLLPGSGQREVGQLPCLLG
jgi:hypothetical protein